MRLTIKFIKLFVLINFSLNSQMSAGKLLIKSEEYVYLCNGPSSKVFHKSKSCKGLSRCSTQITRVSQSTAHFKRRRACRIEY